MRKQRHFRRGPEGLDAWDVDRLVELSKDQPIEQIELKDIKELDEIYWFDHGYVPTVRAVAKHARLINQVDLAYPIIVDPDGRVMDGMHRVARALLNGHRTIPARRLPVMPEPDYRNHRPDDLP